MQCHPNSESALWVENITDVKRAFLMVYESRGHVEDVTAGVNEFG